jgi:hypothetical protein
MSDSRSVSVTSVVSGRVTSGRVTITQAIKLPTRKSVSERGAFIPGLYRCDLPGRL